MDKKIWIRGAGDLATGIALRLYRSGFDIIMSDIAVPTTVRRTVAFSPAVYTGETQVEGITGKLCENISMIDTVIESGCIPVIVDPSGEIMKEYKPDIIVDAIIAKTNIGTKITDADIVIGVGPGFEAGVDCHAVVETKRGHNLGRVIWSGSAYPRATADGVFSAKVNIGDYVKAGDLLAYCDETPVYANIDGIVRGLLQDGVKVKKGMKSGDVDPRAEREYCFSVSDKASAIGGGVLEAILSKISGRRA